MDHGDGKTRMEVEGDRLSSLPDGVIHKILTFVGTKQAMETNVLSSRWRYIWTSMPCLNFSSDDFYSLPEFSKIVTHVLSARNNQTEVHSVKLTFLGKASQVFVKRILDYAFSHSVQQLNITCLLGKKMEFPLSLFSSESLKHLTLNGYAFDDCIMTSPPWELPSLATLHLYCFTLYDDNNDKCDGLFSKCANLKNLSLTNCKMTLNSSVELILHQPSPFANLKGLKIYPDYVTPGAEDEEQEGTMSTEVKNYLLDSSSDATITMVSHDEIRVVRNVKSAQRLMRDLQVLLDRWKSNSETNRTDMKQGEAPIESHMATVHEQLDTEMKWNFEGRMTRIKCYWEDLNEQLEEGYKKTGRIISMLEEIEAVLTKLPTSLRDKLEERFFNLCAEAKRIMGNVMDRMKIQCDKKPSYSNANVDELAASQPLS